jgi:hypothetical protein
MDPIVSEYVTILTNRLAAISAGPYTAATEQQFTSLMRSTISEFASKYGVTNPESVIAIRSLNTPELLVKYTQGSVFLAEAAKNGVPSDTAREIVRQAFTDGTPIGQTSVAIDPKFEQNLELARKATRDFIAKAAKETRESASTVAASPAKTSSVESFVSARNVAPVNITSTAANTLAQAEASAPKVAADAARGLVSREVPSVVEAPSIYRSATSIIPTLLSFAGSRTGKALGAAGIIGGLTYLTSGSDTTAKPAPAQPTAPFSNTPIGPPAAVSAEEQSRKDLQARLENAPNSPEKWDALASIIYSNMVQNDAELSKVRAEFDSLPATATDVQRQVLAIRLNSLLTSKDKFIDDYSNALSKKDEAVKSALANDPENVALLRRASQASIDAQSASAAASRASAARSAVETAALEAKRIRDEQMGPLELAAAEQALKNAQILGSKAELDLQLVQADQRQRAAVDILQAKFDAGELTEEQFTTQALAASGKIEQLATIRLNSQRNQDAREQAAIQQGNWEKSFALQQQTAALAQTQAVAQNAVEQARLDLQRTAEARAVAQARAQNMQALTAAQTQRQAAYNQAATEYERFGVATPNRIQGLQDLKAPIPAAQAAGMLGLDVNSPEFKAVYDTYSMALAPGQGAQQPTQPAPAAPAPGPNPVTNSIPLISMPTMGNTPYLTQALGGLKTGYSPA